MLPLIGGTLSHYKILSKLGEGGMGVVYKAEDTRLMRTVALKFLPPTVICDAEAKERFIHEAQAASALQHANICVIYDIDAASEGELFIVMEYLEGETLKKKIEQGPLPIDEAVDIAVQAARGLARAHDHGIVHRDVKPANIMVTTEGTAKLVDFGLAKLSGRTMVTRAGTTLGTALYMSPEQTRGEKVDRRSDIWSLGVVLYEMLAGKPPFAADYENAVMYEIENAEPKPLTSLRTGIPLELERIVGKCLAKSPDERYQHIDELLVDLNRLRKETETLSTVRPRPQPPPGKRSARKLLLLAGLVVLVAAFFLLRPLFFDEILVSEPKPVAVIAFVNQTGDPAYDYLREAIPNLLITSLEQSKFLRVMTWERMSDVLRQMGKENVGFIDKDLGFALCRREGIHAIVLGSFIKAGDMFATDVKVLDVESKELLKTASARGEGVQSILTGQIDQLSKEVARGVGLSQRKVDASPVQVAEVTTSSMDAYNYFLRGREDLDKLYYPEARTSFEKAVALDSNFATAYLYLSKTYGNLYQLDRVTQTIEKAKALSARAPEKEHLAIEARYAQAVERNPAKYRSLLEELVTKYPMEKRFHQDLGLKYQADNRFSDAQREFEKAIALDPNYALPTNGLAYLYADQGFYEKAIQTLQRYATLSPGDANPFDSMGELYLRMGNLDEAIAKYREALRVQPSFFNTYKSLGYAYALKEDYVECLRLIDSLLATAPSGGVQAEATAWKGVYLLSLGRMRESTRELKAMTELTRRGGNTALLAPQHWVQGNVLLALGNVQGAWQELRMFQTIHNDNNPRIPVTNGVFWSLLQSRLFMAAGRLDSARSCVDRVRRRLDSLETLKPTLIMVAGILEAELLLAEGRPDSAIRVYRSTPLVAISMAGGWRSALYSYPPMRDVVPRAFQAKGQLDSAIAEYEKLLKLDPSTTDRRLISPVYHYRLAALCEKAGRMDRAKAEYSRFLDLWKNADTDRPERIDARNHLRKLPISSGS